MTDKDGLMDIILAGGLIIGVILSIALGILYSTNNNDTTEDWKNTINRIWWPMVYSIFGSFGLAAAAFGIKKFS